MSTVTPGRLAVLAVGMLLLVIPVVLQGTLTVIGVLGMGTYQQELQLPAPPRSALSILGDSSLRITGTPAEQRGDGVRLVERVRYGPRRPTVTAAMQADRLVITTRCPVYPSTVCSVELTLQVPADTALTVRTGGGDVVVDGLSGTLRLDTGGGRVVGTALRGAEVSGRSGGGDVLLSFADPPARVVAGTTGGRVVLTLPGGPYAVDAGSSGGRVTVAVPTAPAAPRRVAAHSGGGDVLLQPAG